MRSHNEIGILAFVPDKWENYWMPRHHIISRLARYYKVLWVSPPLGWRSAIRNRDSGFSPRGVKKISSSFWVYAPERYLPNISRSKFIISKVIKKQSNYLICEFKKFISIINYLISHI